LNGISIASAVFAQIMAECRYALQRAASSPPPLNLSLPLAHNSLGPSELTTQMASRLVQLFLQGSLVWQTDRQNTLLGLQQLAAFTYAVLLCGLINSQPWLK